MRARFVAILTVRASQFAFSEKDSGEIGMNVRRVLEVAVCVVMRQVLCQDCVCEIYE